MASRHLRDEHLDGVDRCIQRRLNGVGDLRNQFTNLSSIATLNEVDVHDRHLLIPQQELGFGPYVPVRSAVRRRPIVGCSVRIKFLGQRRPVPDDRVVERVLAPCDGLKGGIMNVIAELPDEFDSITPGLEDVEEFGLTDAVVSRTSFQLESVVRQHVTCVLQVLRVSQQECHMVESASLARAVLCECKIVTPRLEAQPRSRLHVAVKHDVFTELETQNVTNKFFVRRHIFGEKVKVIDLSDGHTLQWPSLHTIEQD